MKKIRISTIDMSSNLEVVTTEWYYKLLTDELQNYGGLKRFNIEIVDTKTKRLYLNTKNTVSLIHFVSEALKI